jgi:hypothetical protein
MLPMGGQMGPGGPGAMGGPPRAGVGPKPEAGMNDAGPDEVKAQIVMLLNKAKEIATKSGVDWNEVLAEVEGNVSKADVPLPRAPMPPKP